MENISINLIQNINKNDINDTKILKYLKCIRYCFELVWIKIN